MEGIKENLTKASFITGSPIFCYFHPVISEAFFMGNRMETIPVERRFMHTDMKQRIVYLDNILVPPLHFVVVPIGLARAEPGKTAYFSWPISYETLNTAIDYPNSATAKKIRELSF